VCLYSLSVGLTWKLRPGGSIYEGRDGTGKFYAHASSLSGDWTVYLAPWACGRKAGLSIGPFTDAKEAMTAANRHVAAHAETPPR
jgi:hypothetical protein